MENFKKNHFPPQKLTFLKISGNSQHQTVSTRNKPKHQNASTRNKPQHQNASTRNKRLHQNVSTRNKPQHQKKSTRNNSTASTQLYSVQLSAFLFCVTIMFASIINIFQMEIIDNDSSSEDENVPDIGRMLINPYRLF